MLEYTEHKKINRSLWDEAILKSELPLVFAQSYYLDATCPGWDALIYNSYKAVLPVTYGKKLNISYLYQPPFTPQLGVFGTKDANVQQKFIQELTKKFKFIEIELNAANQISSPNLSAKQTFVIDLKQSVNYNENTRRNIAKAKKKGVVIKELTDLKSIQRLTNTVQVPWLISELGISKKHASIFKDLVKNCYHAGALLVLAACDENDEVLSIGYFVSNGKHAVYLKGMSLNKKDNSGSMHALMAHAIDHYQSRALLFDFGGGNTQGMANFYKGLGGTALTYHILKVNNLMWPLNKLKK